jgi:hypothetical protein
MKLKLDFEFQVNANKIQHGDQIILIGSCFSNEMGLQFENNGFKVNSNPFGTIFHPIPLAKLILDSSLNQSQENQIFPRKDLFFSWDAAGSIFHYSEADLNAFLNQIKTQFRQDLLEAKYLFITLGSSFGYVHNQLNNVVANCHKMPSTTFEKSLTDLDSLAEIWNEALVHLKAFNPNLEVIFTVSPIRHIKDGLIENNRSKARLFELIEKLNTNFPIHYFPAYEIILDELRDYRFFKADGVHPNEMAIQYVWQRLTETLMSAETQKLCQEIVQLRQMENHHSLYPKSSEHQEFVLKTKEKIHQFLAKHPSIMWEK